MFEPMSARHCAVCEYICHYLQYDSLSLPIFLVKNFRGFGRPKLGRKRPKYEAPHPEHPQTRQDIADGDIHADHVEAFNASTRRRNSAYRRKTNTYAKKQTSLQRTLDVLWIFHNFIRRHFTTKQVPTVALGILEKGLSWEQVLKIQKSSGIRILTA